MKRASPGSRSTHSSRMALMPKRTLLSCVRPGTVMLRQLSDKLTPFEHSEVLDFPEIWYYGAGAAKIKGMPWAPNNHGPSRVGRRHAALQPVLMSDGPARRLFMCAQATMTSTASSSSCGTTT